MKNILLVILCFFSYSCTSSDKHDIQKVYSDFTTRTITLPHINTYFKDGNSCSFSFSNAYKIILYANPIGCMSCKLQLPQWEKFINELDLITNSRVDVIVYAKPQNEDDIIKILKRYNYNKSICIDMEDCFKTTNELPEDERFHCFLLDNNNNIVLIGNPIHNSRIKELYIRTICDSLGIKQGHHINLSSYHINLGIFKWHETQETSLYIRNGGNKIIHVDTVYTSCECVSAYIEQKKLIPFDSSLVKVTLKAERAEHIMREVYVKIKDKEEIVITIDGEAVE